MVPDAERRLEAAINDLSAHMQQHFADEKNDVDNEWLVLARQILAAQSTSDNDKGDNAATGGIGGEATNVENLAEGEAF